MEYSKRPQAALRRRTPEDGTMATHLIPVTFHDDIVVLVDQGTTEPHVAMKPIVENMGLDWKSQHAKLSEKFESTMVIITTVAEDGRNRDMVCLPLRKLPAWLYSINPAKVSPELRDKVTRYQSECDDVLWNYWTKGEASRQVKATPTAGQIATHGLRLKLLDRLEFERNPAKRLAVHQQLDQISRLLGLPTPPLDAIGRDSTDPNPNHLLDDFWGIYHQLNNNPATPQNHSHTPDRIAINLGQLTQAANTAGLTLPPRTTLLKALPASTAPRCLGNRTVNSKITGKSVKCWVFDTPTG